MTTQLPGRGAGELSEDLWGPDTNILLVMPNVLLVQAAVRRFLQESLQSATFQVADSIEDALVKARRARPDVVLCGGVLPDGDPAEFSLRLRSMLGISVPVLVYTIYVDKEIVLKTLKSHVAGYLFSLETTPEALIAAINSARQGLTVLGPKAMQVVDDSLDSWHVEAPDPSTFSQLSRREREVLKLMTEGLTNREIAQRISTSTRTVQVHVAHIIDKLEARSRTHAVILALRAAAADPAHQLPSTA